MAEVSVQAVHSLTQQMHAVIRAARQHYSAQTSTMTPTRTLALAQGQLPLILPWLQQAAVTFAEKLNND